MSQPHLTRELSSPDETAAFAREFASSLRPGDLALIDGPLGAGKTTLVRGIAVAMGADPAMVSSPTFVVAQVYPTGEGRPDLVHVDAYRLTGDDGEELEQLGWDRLASGNAVVLVEWGERVEELLDRSGSPEPVRIRIEPTGVESRSIEIEPPVSWSDRVLPGGAGPAPEGTPRQDTVCRVTGRRVPADSPTWPFADERARMADLYKWFSEGYAVSRPMEQADLEQGE